MPKPPYKMFIDEITASRRIGNFIKLKYPFLCGLIQKPEAVCIFYTAAQIIDLITKAAVYMGADSGLRVYFATYLRLADGDTGAKANNALIPPGADDQLTLIFAPTTWTGKAGKDEEDHRDTGNYFVIDPVKAIFVDLKGIDPGIFTRWTEYYDNKKRIYLSKSFNIEETKKMWYEYEKILDLKVFLSTASHKIKYVTAFFASYHRAERASRKLNNGANKSYDVFKKLTLVFLLASETDGMYTALDFASEDRSDLFSEINEKLEEFLEGTGGDTGVPCPPAVCK